MSKIILTTGASSGFGRLPAETLASGGHTVYASMQVRKLAIFADDNSIDLRNIELDVQSQDSVDAAVAKLMADDDRIDVLVRNTSDLAFGPAEAFMPNQYAQLYLRKFEQYQGAAHLAAMPTRETRPIAASMASPAQVVVAVFTGPDAPAIAITADLERWRRLTPLAGWKTINLRSIARSEILRSVAAVLKQQQIAAHQLILLGGGIVMRRVLELVLQGALVCAGMLAIDIPCTPLRFRIAPTAAAIRLVVQHGPKGVSDDLVRALQAADLDKRIITLNPTGRSDARVAASAAETFVLELVATVGRQAHHGG